MTYCAFTRVSLESQNPLFETLSLPTTGYLNNLQVKFGCLIFFLRIWIQFSNGDRTGAGTDRELCGACPERLTAQRVEDENRVL